MVEFMRAGGFGMWLVLLLGSATLVTGVLFARRPDERRMAVIRALTVATVFSTFTALASNVATVMYTVPQHPEWSKSADLHLIVMTGLGESLTPVILGTALLTLTWLVAAVGMRRLSDRLSEIGDEALAAS